MERSRPAGIVPHLWVGDGPARSQKVQPWHASPVGAWAFPDLQISTVAVKTSFERQYEAGALVLDSGESRRLVLLPATRQKRPI